VYVNKAAHLQCKCVVLCRSHVSCLGAAALHMCVSV